MVNQNNVPANFSKELFLLNKRVLFITFGFYNYPFLIKKTIESYGAEVHYYNTVSGNNALFQRLLSKSSHNKRLKRKILKDNHHYDYIFIINLKSFEKDFLIWLFNRYKTAHKILYLWDSLANCDFDKGSIRLFDKVFSFDKEDVENNKGFLFLPLFHCADLPHVNNPAPIYDFSFVGIARDDRYRIISKLSDFSNKNGYSYCFKLYLRSRFFYIYKKLFFNAFKKSVFSDFTFKKTSFDELNRIVNNSRIIIDIQSNNQNGLTMRTIETLGSHKKLITTNKSIISYDFYNPKNILIIDPLKISIPTSFIEEPYEEMDGAIYKKYHISSWVYHIFSHFE